MHVDAVAHSKAIVGGAGYRFCPRYVVAACSAKIANDRFLAVWSNIWAVTISSSAPVEATKAPSPFRTVSGPPTTEQDNASASIARPYRSTLASKSSTGGGSLPGRPRRRFRNACCCDENSRRASDRCRRRRY
jgi:hypothetical protein